MSRLTLRRHHIKTHSAESNSWSTYPPGYYKYVLIWPCELICMLRLLVFSCPGSYNWSVTILKHTILSCCYCRCSRHLIVALLSVICFTMMVGRYSNSLLQDQDTLHYGLFQNTVNIPHHQHIPTCLRHHIKTYCTMRTHLHV